MSYLARYMHVYEKKEGSKVPSESCVKAGTLKERVLALNVSIEGTSEERCSSWKPLVPAYGSVIEDSVQTNWAAL